MRRNVFRRTANMAMASGPGHGTSDKVVEALRTLSKYLELSLDVGGCVVIMRPRAQACAMYVGNLAGSENSLQSYGTIGKVLAEEILQLTHAGVNSVDIDGQSYRFTRSFTHISHHGGVVFSPI